MSLLYLALAIALVVITLVVRDRCDFRLSRMRAELVSLRSEEKRLSDEHQELDRLVLQVADALGRASAQQTSADEACRAITEALSTMGVSVDLPAPALGAQAPPEAPPQTDAPPAAAAPEPT